MNAAESRLPPSRPGRACVLSERPRRSNRGVRPSDFSIKSFKVHTEVPLPACPCASTAVFW
eukprot:7382989-Prymnesium_polylepis.1